MKSLTNIQTRLMKAITDPRPSDQNEARSLIVPTSKLGSRERLNIYKRAYHGRLLECLKIEYPCLHKTLGEEVFKQFALDYLQKYPPKSYSISQIGKHFPNYLADTNPNEKLADEHKQKREHWCDFIVDLARLERIFLETYDALGSEEKTLLTADTLLGINHSAFLNLKVYVVKELRTLKLRCRVDKYFEAYRREETASIPSSKNCALAFFRKNYVVKLQPLSIPEMDFIDELQKGKTVRQTLSLVNSLSPEEARCTLLNLADIGSLLHL